MRCMWMYVCVGVWDLVIWVFWVLRVWGLGCGAEWPGRERSEVI